VTAFGVTVTLWLVPAVVGLVAGHGLRRYALVDNRLNEGVVGRRPAVRPAGQLVASGDHDDWRDASKIDWGAILLFGTGIIFGAMLSATGLAKTIGKGRVERAGCLELVRDHRVRGGARDHHLRDHEQHRLGGRGGADRYPARGGG